MLMKARVEAMRALSYRIAHYDDMSQHSDDSKYKALVDLLTPVVKAHNSDMCDEVTNKGIQVLGGYGYCGEYPQEQAARDSKIFTIWEGANGIQALDLIGRKLTQNSGMLFMQFLGEATELIEPAKEVPGLKDEVSAVEKARDKLAEVTMRLGQAGMMGDRELPVLVATPYLAMFGDVTYAVLLLNQAAVAQKKLDQLVADAGSTEDELCEKSETARYYYNKVLTAQFFAHEVLPSIYGRAMSIEDGNRAAIAAKF
jgi:hypothetical protein